MAIDYSVFKHKKDRVKALDQREARAALEKTDRKENAKAKKRAGGRCEMVQTLNEGSVFVFRCPRKVAHVHHLIGGIGRRARGKSASHLHKLVVCEKCHRDIHAKVLRPTTDTDEASKIRYWRSR